MLNVERRAGTVAERCNLLKVYSSCPTDAKPLLVAAKVVRRSYFPAT